MGFRRSGQAFGPTKQGWPAWQGWRWWQIGPSKVIEAKGYRFTTALLVRPRKQATGRSICHRCLHWLAPIRPDSSSHYRHMMISPCIFLSIFSLSPIWISHAAERACLSSLPFPGAGTSSRVLVNWLQDGAHQRLSSPKNFQAYLVYLL